MASVFDTARYILNERGTMSAMKLQKLCYYCQAWSLVWDDMELFPQEFQAWANGPVCPELYFQTKGQFDVKPEDEPGNPDALTDNQKDSIRIVLDYYGDKSAQWLSQLTHAEAPWKQAREGVAPGEYSKNIVSKESMSIYYGGL